VTAQGHPRAIFTRAIERGNLVVAEATARELGRLTLEEVLRLLFQYAEAARQVIDADLEDGEAAIREAHPTWSLGETPVCYLKAASTHITFGLWCPSIDDPSGRLESFCNVMRQVKLRREADVDKNLFANWLRQVRAITATGSA
jgi:Domain of unknown function (DU1801)